MSDSGSLNRRGTCAHVGGAGRHEQLRRVVDRRAVPPHLAVRRAERGRAGSAAASTCRRRPGPVIAVSEPRADGEVDVVDAAAAGVGGGEPADGELAEGVVAGALVGRGDRGGAERARAVAQVERRRRPPRPSGSRSGSSAAIRSTDTSAWRWYAPVLAGPARQVGQHGDGGGEQADVADGGLAALERGHHQQHHQAGAEVADGAASWCAAPGWPPGRAGGIGPRLAEGRRSGAATAASAPATFTAPMAPNMSPMKPVTAAVASRSRRRQARSRLPSRRHSTERDGDGDARRRG